MLTWPATRGGKGPKTPGSLDSLQGWRSRACRSRQLRARPLEEREDKTRCAPECGSEEAAPRATRAGRHEDVSRTACPEGTRVRPAVRRSATAKRPPRGQQGLDVTRTSAERPAPRAFVRGGWRSKDKGKAGRQRSISRAGYQATRVSVTRTSTAGPTTLSELRKERVPEARGIGVRSWTSGKTSATRAAKPQQRKRSEGQQRGEPGRRATTRGQRRHKEASVDG